MLISRYCGVYDVIIPACSNLKILDLGDAVPMNVQ